MSSSTTSSDRSITPKQTQETLSFVVDDTSAGLRLDAWLTSQLTDHSRTALQELIASSHVLVNGLPAKKRTALSPGDTITVALPPKAKPFYLTSTDVPFSILYEDDDLLIVDKPPGVVVHPGVGNPTHTLIQALRAHLDPELLQDDSIRPGIVHRLDKNTSGLLIVAKRRQAHAHLVASFARRQVDKQYLALCRNNPGDGTIEAPIGRDPHNRKRFATAETGKAAFTRYVSLSHNERSALVLLLPRTGRTHQLRVHMAACGAPILGDSLYGGGDRAAARQLLHAYRLQFHHPQTGKLLDFTAPIPEDFLCWLHELGETPASVEARL